jgi:PAS domain S-box-containing protein
VFNVVDLWRRIHLRAGLRPRILLISILGTLPAIATLTWATVDITARTRQAGVTRALEIAHGLAQKQSDVFRSTRQALVSIAASENVRTATMPRCQAIFSSVLAQYGWLTNAWITDASGDLQCSSIGVRGLNRGGRPDFVDAMRMGTFSIGTYRTGSLTGRTVIPVSLPIRNAEGRIEGTMGASIDVAWIASLLADSGAPSDTLITIIDGKNYVVLFRNLDPGPYVGQRITDPSYIQALNEDRAPVTQGTDFEGRARIFAFAKVPESGVIISIGLPEAGILGAVSSFTQFWLAALLAGGAATCLFIWWGITRFVLRPINVIEVAAAQLARGNVITPSSITGAVGEIGSLGRQFNLMARSLHEREVSLQETNERLASAEKRLRNAVDSMQDGFLLWDADDRLAVVNKAARQLLPGNTFELGTCFVDAFRSPGDMVPALDGDTEEALTERQQRRAHRTGSLIEQKSADGRWLQISEQRTAEGGSINVVRDISKEKRVEAFHTIERHVLELITTNAPLESTLDALCLACADELVGGASTVMVAEPDGKHLRLLSGATLPADLRGAIPLLPVAEGVGACGTAAHRRERVVVADVSTDPLFAIGREQLLAHGLHACWSQPMIDAEGRVIGTFAAYFTTTRTPAKWEDEIITRFSRLAVVAIERTAAQQALRESGQRLDAIMEHTVDGLITIDQNGTVLSFSGPAEKIFGYRAAEVIGHNVSMLMPEPHHWAHDEFLDALKTGEAKLITTGREVVEQRKDGTTFPMDLAVGEIPTTSGSCQVVATVRDITQRVATEQQLRQAQKMEATGQLTGGIAHDFNNVLAIILGNLEMVVDDAKRAAFDTTAIETAIRATHKGADLTRRLLAFARRMPLKPEPVEVDRLILDMVRLFGRSLGETVAVETRLTTSGACAMVDRGQLESALLNLAVNARDAMPQGGRLLIETKTVDAQVCILVTDTGAGMTPEVLAQAYEPFFTTKPTGKGTGLGLSMVYGFVKQSGGQIAIDSVVGRGTTVAIHLPQAPASDRADQGAPAPQPARPARQNLLLVEDDPDVRTATARQLEILGYIVKPVADGMAALNLLTSPAPIDLVLTDMVLPGGLNGLDIGREARRLRPGLAVLCMSGYPQAPENAARLRAEGIELLAKPFTKAQLAAALATAAAA